MAELKFGIYGDSSGFKQAIDEATKSVSQAKQQIEQNGQSMANVFSSLKTAAMGLGVAFGLKELKNLGFQIASTRSDFQQLEVSFKTMLGSGEKANELLKQLTTTAAVTPFGLQDVAGGAKQLLAYGIEAEKVNDTLVRLGDIAAGLSIPLNDLVYLYGTTMVQGKMFTQDLKQFQGRGIPIADELAKQFGIAKSEVADFVSKGKVGAKEVEQAIINMTSAGSQFGGLMDAQSKTIGGKWSNIEDQIDTLFNDIGKDSEGAIYGVLDALSGTIEFLSENYKQIGIVLGGIISMYGVWKTTLVAHNALRKVNEAGEIAYLTKIAEANMALMQSDMDRVDELIANAEALGDADAYVELMTQKEALAKNMETTQEQLNSLAKNQNTIATTTNSVATGTNTTATTTNTIATGANTTATKSATIAQKLHALAVGGVSKALKALKAAFMSNPIGLIATAVTGVVTSLMFWKSNQVDVNKALDEGADKAKTYVDSVKQENSKIKSLVNTIRDRSSSQSDQVSAYQELIKLVPELTNEYSRQELAALSAAEAEALLTDTLHNREIQQLNKAKELNKAAIKELNEGKDWTALTPQVRKYLKEEFSFDEDFDANEMIVQIKGITEGLNEAIASADILNKMSQATSIVNVENRVKAIKNTMAEFDEEIGDSYEFWSKLNEFGFQLDKFIKDGSAAIGGEVTTNILNQAQADMQAWVNTINADVAPEMTALLNSLRVKYEENVGAYIAYDEELRRRALNKVYRYNQEVFNAYNTLKSELESASKDESMLKDLSGNFEAVYRLDKSDVDKKIKDLKTQMEAIKYFKSVIELEFKGDENLDHEKLKERVLANVPPHLKKTIEWLLSTYSKENGVTTSDTLVENLDYHNDVQGEILKVAEQRQKELETAEKNYQKALELKRKVIEAEQSLNNTRLKNEKDFIEDLTDIENKKEQLLIDIENDGIKRRRMSFDKDQKERISELEKDKESAINAEKDRQKDLFEAQEKRNKAEAEKNGTRYNERVWTEELLNTAPIDEIKEKYKELYDLLLKLQSNQNEDFANEERKAQDEYLKQYGTYLEQIEAVTRLYNDRIKDATTEGERKTLEKQRDAEVKNINAEAYKKNINWDNIFGDIAYRSIDSLRAMREEIRKMILEQKDLKPEDIAKLYEQYNKVGQAIDDSSFSFAKFVGWNNEAKDKAERLKKEYEDAKKLFEELVQKQQQNTIDANDSKRTLAMFLANYGITIGDKSQETLAQEVAKVGGEGAVSEFNELYDANAKASDELKETTENVEQAGKAMNQAGEEMENASESAEDSYQHFMKIMEKIGANLQSLGQLFEELGLEDTPLAKGVGKLGESFSSATQAIQDFKSGNFVGMAANALASLRSLGDALAEFGLEGFGSSDINLHDDLEKLSKTNEALTHAMEELSEVIAESSFADATEAFLQSTEYLKQSIKNTQESMQRSAKASSAGFLGIGSKGSSARAITKGITANEWQRVSAIVGNAVDSATDFLNLSSEQMAKVARDAPDIYARIKDLADEGYEDASQYFDEYIEYYKQLEELENQWREKVTSTSFDEISDEFKSTLLDMEASSEDFANSFEDMMANAIVSALMADKYRPLIEQWWKDYSDYMKDGVLDSVESKELRDAYMQMAKDAQKDRDMLFQTAGINLDGSSKSSASNRGIESMAQEEASELTGRFTALQIAGEAVRSESVRTNELIESLISQIAPSIATSAESNNTLYELRELALARNIFLSDISDYTKNLIAIKNTLTKIESNTQNL